MAGNSIGRLFRVTTWGESHGPAVGVVIDGCPAGIKISLKKIQEEVDRRKPVDKGSISTTRREQDRVRILSGIFGGKTTGMPIAMIVENRDTKTKDYVHLKNTYRPGHADFTYDQKYGIRDYLGGGRSSGRETVCRVMAGAVAKIVLSHFEPKLEIFGHTLQIGIICAPVFSEKNKKNREKNPVRCLDISMAKKMIDYIEQIRIDGDSIGGVIELRIHNCPIGLGEPVFDKLGADLAKALLSIPATKGIAFGEGFGVAEMKGSQNNDTYIKINGKIKPKTNHAGGLLGGISTGEPIIMQLAIKPPSSISMVGRHDSCIVPRVISVAESMVAIVLLDHLLRQKTARI
jgi:chorismate synthase